MGQLAKGKVKAFYALPAKLVERIGRKAVKERKRPCDIAERVIERGLAAERADEEEKERPAAAGV